MVPVFSCSKNVFNLMWWSFTNIVVHIIYMYKYVYVFIYLCIYVFKYNLFFIAKNL